MHATIIHRTCHVNDLFLFFSAQEREVCVKLMRQMLNAPCSLWRELWSGCILYRRQTVTSQPPSLPPWEAESNQEQPGTNWGQSCCCCPAVPCPGALLWRNYIFLKKSFSSLPSIDGFPVRDSQALRIQHNEKFLFDITAWLETGTTG
jgi:hypothetical protein